MIKLELPHGGSVHFPGIDGSTLILPGDRVEVFDASPVLRITRNGRITLFGGLWMLVENADPTDLSARATCDWCGYPIPGDLLLNGDHIDGEAVLAVRIGGQSVSGQMHRGCRDIAERDGQLVEPVTP